MYDYRNKQVVIVGLGLTGLACVDFFVERGVIPKVMDTRIKPPELKNLPDGIAPYLGGLNTQWLMTADLIVVSPGVALTIPELHEARQAGIEIIGDIELFCREVCTPIVAITGSNGKSTVTRLVGEMAQAAGWHTGVGGNIGVSALTLLKQQYQLFVLELSSFQLECTRSLQAIAATVLNVTEDHSDRYPLGLAQYRAAKLRIYDNAEKCIVNADDELTFPDKGMDRRCIHFGADRGDYRLHVQPDGLWLQAYGESVLNTRAMKLTGQHNYCNALSALALADVAGIPRSASLQVLSTWSGLEHRYQRVWENNQICWINDSKATNVGSTMAALSGLKVDGTLHLLLGGEGKSADFSPLTRLLQGGHIRVYCFGQDAQKLAQLRPEISELSTTMEQAMRKLATRLKSGDVVLLSPACASLDQFQNFEQRGQEFTRLAQELG